MKILMTCFQPFAGNSTNSSLELLKKMPKSYKNHKIYQLILDVAYVEAGQKVIEEIKKIHPDLILLFGQAGGRSCLTIEYFALNMRSSEIEDNRGVVLTMEEILKDGDLALKTTLPLDRIKDCVGNLLKLSYHAGTYVCNDVYYQVLHFLKEYELEIPCGFLHIPYLKEQGEMGKNFTMELAKVFEITTNLLDCLLEEPYGTISGN